MWRIEFQIIILYLLIEIDIYNKSILHKKLTDICDGVSSKSIALHFFIKKSTPAQVPIFLLWGGLSSTTIKKKWINICDGLSSRS